MRKIIIQISCIMLSLLMIAGIAGCAKKDDDEWSYFSEYQVVPGKNETVSDDAENGDVASETEKKNDNKTSENKKSSKSTKTNNSKGTSAVITNASKEEVEKERSIYPDLTGKTVVRLLWDTPSDLDKKIYENFTKVTGCKVKTVVTTYTNYLTKLTAMVAANTTCDSAMMHQAHFPLQITKKLIQPCTKYVDKNDTMLDLAFMDQFKWNGEYYGMMLKGQNQNHMVVYFNVDMFDDAENVKDNPLDLYKAGKWNFNTFLDLCKKMQKKDNSGQVSVYGCAFNDCVFPIATGHDVVSISNGKLINDILNPDCLYGYQFIKDIAWKSNICIKTKGVLADYFANGKAAMAIQGAYGINRSKQASSNAELYKMKDKWDWVPFPDYVDANGNKKDSYQPTLFYEWTIPVTAKYPDAGYYFNRWCIDPYALEGTGSSKTSILTSADITRLDELYSRKSSASFFGGVVGEQDSYDLSWDLQKPDTDITTAANAWKTKVDAAIAKAQK